VRKVRNGSQVITWPRCPREDASLISRIPEQNLHHLPAGALEKAARTVLASRSAQNDVVRECLGRREKHTKHLAGHQRRINDARRRATSSQLGDHLNQRACPANDGAW
jgi:hypothetical protein